MVNYYDILKVSPKATGTEIKSAYRRLARKLHPDKNHGSEETAMKFAEIAEAYEVLGNPKERAKYDRRMLDASYANGNGNSDSFFTSMNPHARRWRQMVYEKRYNDIIDRMIAEERKEAMAFQKVVYPLVAFLFSCFLMAAIRPKIVFGESSSPVALIIVIVLFAVGVIRIVGRLRDGFERFTEPDDDIHESILDNQERKRKPYSRLAAAGALVLSSLVLAGIGYLIGTYIEIGGGFGLLRYADWRDPAVVEFVLYPPIITFLVDGIHSIVTYFETRRDTGEVSRITSD